MEICKVFREYGWDQAAGGNWDTVISWLIEAMLSEYFVDRNRQHRASYLIFTYKRVIVQYYANEIRPAVIISRCMVDDLPILRFLGSAFPIVRIKCVFSRIMSFFFIW